MKIWKSFSRRERMMFAVLCGFIALIAGVTIYITHMYTSSQMPQEQYKEYDRHYVMIGKNPADPFWLAVYEAAREQGEVAGAYVENYGENMSREYTVEERLEMVVAAGSDRTVDKIHGIIVEADTSERVKELIDMACDKNMPVVTILTDSGDDTKRKSFIGVNHSDLGRSYGACIQDLIAETGSDKDEVNVRILLDYGDGESYQNITYAGIVESLRSTKAVTESTQVDKSVMFSAEETIRGLVLDQDTRPDILVCLSEEDTIAAQQVVIDMNLVGEVKILGYYDSEEILTGISKGIILTTAVIDTGELGVASIETLDAYVDTRYVSEWQLTGNEVYFITQENVAEYMEEVRNEQE